MSEDVKKENDRVREALSTNEIKVDVHKAFKRYVAIRIK